MNYNILFDQFIIPSKLSGNNNNVTNYYFNSSRTYKRRYLLSYSLICYMLCNILKTKIKKKKSLKEKKNIKYYRKGVNIMHNKFTQLETNKRCSTIPNKGSLKTNHHGMMMKH